MIPSAATPRRPPLAPVLAVLLAIQLLALGLQLFLLLHKQRELLIELAASRVEVTVAPLELRLTAARTAGLTLRELPRLAQELLTLAQRADVPALDLFVPDAQPPRVGLSSDTRRQGSAIDPADAAAALAGGAWRREHADMLHVGHATPGSALAPGHAWVAQLPLAPIRAQLFASLTALLLPLGEALVLAAAGVPLLLWAGQRLAPHLGLRTTLSAGALLLSLATGSVLSLQALDQLQADLEPALQNKADSVANDLAAHVQHALALGIPFAGLTGVQPYIDELLVRHPELAGIRLAPADDGPGWFGGCLASRGGVAHAVVHDHDGMTLARVEVRADDDVVARRSRELRLDVAVVFIVSMVAFGEVLGAVLALSALAPRPAPGQGLGGLRLALFLLILSEEITRAFLPLHVGALALPPPLQAAAAASLAVTAYMLSFALVTPWAGGWVTRYGSTRVFVAGALLSALGFAIAAAADGLAGFVAARLLSAAGYAVGTLAVQVQILGAAGPQARARGLAMYVGALQSAAICGAALGGVLAQRFGARPVFVLAATLAVLALLLHRRAGLAVAPGDRGGRGNGLLRLLRRPALLVPLLAAAIPAKVALAGFLFYLTPLALRAEGYAAGDIGRALMLYSLTVAAVNPLAAVLMARLGRPATWVVLGSTVIGLGGLAGLANATWSVWCGIAALGVGTGLSAAALQTHIAEAGLHEQAGPAALVLLRTVERYGAMLGPLLAGAALAGLGYGGAMALIGALVLAGALTLALQQARAARQRDRD